MSHRLARFVLSCAFLSIVVGVMAAAVAAGGGQPPPAGTPPYNPPPPSGAAATACPMQETHPIPCRLWAVTCPATAVGNACTATVSGLASASVRRLALRLSKRFFAVTLTCRAADSTHVSCRIVDRTIHAASGTRTVVLTLPNRLTVLVACATDSRERFACRIQK